MYGGAFLWNSTPREIKGSIHHPRDFCTPLLMFPTEGSNYTHKCNYANIIITMVQSEKYGSILRSDESEIALDISSEEDDFSLDESGEVNACFLF